MRVWRERKGQGSGAKAGRESLSRKEEARVCFERRGDGLVGRQGASVWRGWKVGCLARKEGARVRRERRGEGPAQKEAKGRGERLSRKEG